MRIHALVDRLRREVDDRIVSPKMIVELAEAFEEHIRFEKVLFPPIERLAGSSLDGIELADRQRSEAWS